MYHLYNEWRKRQPIRGGESPSGLKVNDYRLNTGPFLQKTYVCSRQVQQ